MIPLSPEELAPGLTLAEAVYNHQEILLAEKGTKLSLKHIRIFKSWGVKQIFVQSEQPGNDAGSGTAEVKPQKSIQLELNRKFVDVLDDPVMVAIMKAAGRQLTKKLHEPEDRDEHA